MKIQEVNNVQIPWIQPSEKDSSKCIEVKMVQQTFSVHDDNVEKLKSFIRQHTPTVRFKSNPCKINDRWEFYISSDISDANKLSVLLNEFYLKENPPKKKTLLQRFFDWIT